MKKIIPFLAALLLLACSRGPAGQTAPLKDQVISGALAQVSVDSVRTYIDDLVGFHTRHTLSTQTDPAKGIGAAVEYLAARCERWAAAAPAARPRPLVERVRYAVGGSGGRY